MEAKQKAKELVNKYYNSLPQWVNTNDAKQCALIAVDEILELGLHDVGNYKDFKGIPCEWYISYWKEVEQEICDL